jgi:hypothetical protein
MALLPQQIPPQPQPLGQIELDPDGKPTGKVLINVDWYLFLYNISKNTLSAPATPIPVPPATFLSIPEDESVPPNPLMPNTLIWLDPI